MKSFHSSLKLPSNPRSSAFFHIVFSSICKVCASLARTEDSKDLKFFYKSTEKLISFTCSYTGILSYTDFLPVPYGPSKRTSNLRESEYEGFSSNRYILIGFIRFSYPFYNGSIWKILRNQNLPPKGIKVLN